MVAVNSKFSNFYNGGDLAENDIVVGLRDGVNTRFNFPGYLPSGYVVSVEQGGTGRDNAVAYAIAAGGVDTTSALQYLPTGTAGQLLQSGGAAALPSWTTAALPPGS